MRFSPHRIFIAWLGVSVCAAAPLPPTISPASGVVHTPALVTITKAAGPGAIFFTTDGSDPRGVLGEVAPTAQFYRAAVKVNCSMTIRARVKTESEWSDASAEVFIADQDFSRLLFTEVMFHPQDRGDLAEFVELKNIGHGWVDLSGLRFVAHQGVPENTEAMFQFPPNTRIGPGQFLILASWEPVFRTRYPQAPLHGVFMGEISNSLASLAIRNDAMIEAVSMSYETAAPWQVVPDNHGYFEDDDIGFSLVRVNYDPSADPAHPGTWRSSAARYGSPGKDDPLPNVPPIYINELLTRTATGARDAVEFFNPNPFEVDLGGWWLSDERNVPYQYRIPAGTVVGAGGYLVMDDTQFGTGPDPVGFSADGERCYLFSGDADGNLTGYSHGLQFGAGDPDVTFGRTVTSDGREHFPQVNAVTFGAVNAGPKISPVVISEIMYRPLAGEPVYVELRNTTNAPITLSDPQHPQNGWSLGWGFVSGMTMPPGTIIPAQGHLIVVAEAADAFRARHNVPVDVPIISVPAVITFLEGWVSLVRPSGMSNGVPRYVELEQVNFRDRAPWPNGVVPGVSIERIRLNTFADEPTNWRVSPTGRSPGVANTGDLPPAVWAGVDRTEFVGTAVSLGGAVADDRWSGASAIVEWSQLSGPGVAQFVDAGNPQTAATFPVGGQYVLRLQANDGAAIVSDTVSIQVVSRPFDAWQASLFSPAERANPDIGGPLGDPDRDGRPNLQEYFYASHPRIANHEGGPVAAIVNGKLQIRWKERNGIIDLVVKPERGDHLQGPWFDTPELFEWTRVNQGAVSEVTVTERIPKGNRPTGYLRLRVMLR